MPKLYYEILGIKEDATRDEIKRAYKQKVRETHPDLGGNTDEFIKLVKAFETLIDEELRKEYDSTGKEKETISLSDIASSVVQSYFKKFLNAGPSILKMDVLSEIKKLLSLDENRNRLITKKLNEQLNLLIEVKSRVEKISNSRFFPIEDSIDEEIESCREKLKKTNYQSLVYNIIDRILKDYKYRFDIEEIDKCPEHKSTGTL